MLVEIVVRVAETHTAARFHVLGAFTLIVRFTPNKTGQTYTLSRFVKRPSRKRYNSAIKLTSPCCSIPVPVIIAIARIQSRSDGQSIWNAGTIYHTFSFERIPSEPTHTLATVANDGTCGVLSLKTG